MGTQTIIQEYYVDRHHYCLTDDYIICVTLNGEVDYEQALRCKAVSTKLHTMFEGPKRVLVDLNKAGKQSAEARKVFAELTDLGARPVKVALWGLHPVARIIASFFAGITDNKKSKFFSDKEKALSWLKEKIEP